MGYDPSGFPSIPQCGGGDIARFMEELQDWLDTKFGAVHSEVAGVSVSPFDICTEKDNLSAPDCLIAANGVDQTGFTYAASADEVLVAGSGVLPYPESVEAGEAFDHASASWNLVIIINAQGQWNGFTSVFTKGVDVKDDADIPPGYYRKWFLSLEGSQLPRTVHGLLWSETASTVTAKGTFYTGSISTAYDLDLTIHLFSMIFPNP